MIEIAGNAVFLAVTLLFAFLVAIILKFVFLRYYRPLALPLWVWVIIIALAAYTLKGLGVPVEDEYARFFKYLARVLEGL